MSVRILQPFGAVLESEGVCLSVLLEAAGVAKGTYQSLRGRVSYDAAGRFFAAAMQHTGFAALGLEAARRLDTARFQLLEYLAASSADVNSALESLVRYQAVFGDRRVLSLEEVAAGRLLRFQPSRGAPRCFIEYVVGALALASVRAAPRRNGEGELGQVWFAYEPPPATDAYQSFFGRKPVFHAMAHGIFVPSAQLGQPMTRANSELRDLLAQQITRAGEGASAPEAVAERVRALLLRELAGSPPSLAHTARRLSMSASTLKRRLSREGKSYTRLLDELRREQAVALLRDPALSVMEVAHSTGYTDATAFDKAFRRWTGQSPSQHRGRRSQGSR